MSPWIPFSSARKRLRRWLTPRGSKYAFATWVVVALIATKWLYDAYSLDRNVETWGNAVYWNSYDSSFTPWPHLGEDLTNRCANQHSVCELISVPDLSSMDRAIHGFLNITIPFTNIPIAPLIAVGIMAASAYGVYRNYRNATHS